MIQNSLKILKKIKYGRPLPSVDQPDLPVEILVDAPEDLEACRHEFKDSARCIAPKRKPADLVAMGARGQYGYKGMALLESSFDEVLFLDEDVVPLHDPALLFESCEFKRTGALFMPDIFGHACADNLDDAKESQTWGQTAWPEHVMWAITGGKWEPKWPLAQEFETGAMLVDKTRHLKALKLALHFIESVEVQKIMYGDKDCFKYAFVALGESYALASDRPTRLLIQTKEDIDRTSLIRYNGIGELQRMMGVYMFTHHLPRPLSPVIVKNGRTSSFNQNQSVALVLPQSRQGKMAYSYCPYRYGQYVSNEYQARKHWFACFPKENMTCPEQEFYGKPSGLLQDGVDGLMYLSDNGI